MLTEQTERLSGLFEAQGDRLYRLARRLVSSADDALDLVQETFLKAAPSPKSIPHGLTDEEAWLVRVLINVRRDQWRREAVRKRHELERSHTTTRHDDPETAFLIRTTVWKDLRPLTTTANESGRFSKPLQPTVRRDLWVRVSSLPQPLQSL